MQKIIKMPIETVPVQTISIQRNHRFLSVQAATSGKGKTELSLTAIVETTDIRDNLTIAVLSTGAVFDTLIPQDQAYHFIGAAGDYHVFEMYV